MLRPESYTKITNTLATNVLSPCTVSDCVLGSGAQPLHVRGSDGRGGAGRGGLPEEVMFELRLGDESKPGVQSSGEAPVQEGRQVWRP